MSVAKMIEQDMQTDEFWSGVAKLEFVVSLNKIMDEKGISRSDLARLSKKSPGYITKIMSGDANLTIESMVMFARCVGMRFVPQLQQEKPAGRSVSMPVTNYRTKQDDTLVRCYARP